MQPPPPPAQPPLAESRAAVAARFAVTMRTPSLARQLQLQPATTTTTTTTTTAAAAVEAVRWLAWAWPQTRDAPVSRGSVAAAVRRCEDAGGAFGEVVRLVGSVFSDPAKLAACFPLPLVAATPPSCATEEALATPAKRALVHLPLTASPLETLDVDEIERVVSDLIAVPQRDERAAAVRNSCAFSMRSLVMAMQVSAHAWTPQSKELRAWVFAWEFARLSAAAAQPHDQPGGAKPTTPPIREMQVLQTLHNAPSATRWAVVSTLARVWGSPTALIERLQGAITSFMAAASAGEVVVEYRTLAPALELLDMASKTFGGAPTSYVNAALADYAAKNPMFLDREFIVWRRSTNPHEAGAPLRATASSQEHVSVFQTPHIGIDTACKAHGLQLDADLKHHAELRDAMMSDEESHFILKVRRDNIVQDTIRAMANTDRREWRKPLKVVFEGEAGVDAGGVRKEFFLLMMRELLSPAFGMFRACEGTRVVWFVPDSVAPTDQLEMIGALVGIAVANRTILDVAFPRALYAWMLVASSAFDASPERAVVSGLGSLGEDPGASHARLLGLGGGAIGSKSIVEQWWVPSALQMSEMMDVVASDEDNEVDPARLDKLLDLVGTLDPALARGLHTLLSFEPAADVESVFQRTHQVSYVDTFGEVRTADLLPHGNGKDVPVTSVNRAAFVRLHCVWTLATSVWRELSAFRRGFLSAVDEDILRELRFRPEELELLVVGVQTLDFAALKESTRTTTPTRPRCSRSGASWRRSPRRRSATCCASSRGQTACPSAAWPTCSSSSRATPTCTTCPRRARALACSRCPTLAATTSSSAPSSESPWRTSRGSGPCDPCCPPSCQ